MGYKLSPLLWDKIRRGLSAGRVQSVAVRLITEREREIAAFVPVEYWSLHAQLAGQHPPEFIATLRGGAAARRPCLADEARHHGGDDARCTAPGWRVKSVTRGERRRNPAPPFITSTLQQDASRKLHFSAKKTMMLAQQLYEGIELGDEGAVGLITYMRTDAVRVARGGAGGARGLGDASGLGASTCPDSAPAYKSKKTRAGRARGHPPGSVAREPTALARASQPRTSSRSTGIIWERFLASQMPPAVYDTVAADITAGRLPLPRPGLDAQVRRLHRGVRGVARGGRRSPRRRRRRRWCRRSRMGETLRAAARSIPSSTSPSRRPLHRGLAW